MAKKIQRLTKNVRLLNNVKDYQKYVRKRSFVSQNIFYENFVAIHESKLVLNLDKQIYVGFSILDLSKLFMHECRYKYNVTKYYNKAKLLFTYTDSLSYENKTDDIYKIFIKIRFCLI